MFNIRFSFTVLGRDELIFSSDLKVPLKLVRSGLCIRYMKLGLVVFSNHFTYLCFQSQNERGTEETIPLCEGKQNML